MSICENCRNAMQPATEAVANDGWIGCNWKMKVENEQTCRQWPYGYESPANHVAFGWVRTGGGGIVNDQLLTKQTTACGSFRER